MAGCSKKQYAIMMSSGSEGQKLASKMGSMEQEEFNKAFAELIQSDSAADASYKAENSKWSKEEDEDYQDFDATSEEDYGFDEEEDEENNDREYSDDAVMEYLENYDYTGNESLEDIKTLAREYDPNITDRDAEIMAQKILESGKVGNNQGEDTKIVSINGQPIDIDNLDMYDDEDIYETDEKGFVLLPKQYKKEIQDALNAKKSEGNGSQNKEKPNLDKIYNDLQSIQKDFSDYYSLDRNGNTIIFKTPDSGREMYKFNEDGSISVVSDEGNSKTYKDYNELKNNVIWFGQLDGSIGNTENPYQSKYKAEDYEDARYYPVSDEDRKAAGPRYLGRYHSIYDAAGLDDKDPAAWKKERDMFKYVGDSSTGASIVQGPDGYYSGNPRINSMAFRTFEQARDYLDRKNPDEHKYGVYFKDGDEREYVYHDKDENGKEYDVEGPDAYKKAKEAAKAKQSEQKMTLEQRQNIKKQLKKISEIFDNSRDLNNKDIKDAIDELQEMLNTKRM